MQNDNIETRSMLPVGTLLQDGKYRIDRHLSSGGFGNTYVATNMKFEEQVAIKEFFMRGISQRDGDSVSVSVSNETNVTQFVSQMEKFRKEARRLRRLRNEHIVAVHDLFDENGTAYYEMDLIKGESLSERLRRTGQPLEESEVMTILEQVLDALAVVHAQGLYHLDLKPANIMIDQNGRALLIDFGASKQLSAGEGYSVSTSSALAYTPGYAPLEQIDQSIKCFGPWTDIYALGATLYKLLTNLTPPSPSELISSRSTLNFPKPVSPRMLQLITWMMKPAFEERPQSVAEVKKFLEVKPEDEETEMVVEPKQETKPQPIVALNEEQHNDHGNEQQKNKKVVDYVKQPFVKSVITFVSIAATFLGAIILFPYVFYFEKKMDIGVYMVLEDIESIIFANYTTILVLFYTSIILMLVPLIVGLRKINVLVSNLFVIASILVIGLLLDNLLGYSYVYLFLGYSLLYIIIGIIILRNYLGNLRHYGMMLIIIGIVNSLSQTSYYWTDEIIGYYVLFVFGRSVLFIWCTWWFLTRKEPKNHETI